jgi:hypothetical protein
MKTLPKGNAYTGRIKFKVANRRRKDNVHISQWRVRLWSKLTKQFSVVHLVNFTVHPLACSNKFAVLEYDHCRLEYMSVCLYH